MTMRGPAVRFTPTPEGGWYTDLFFEWDGKHYGTRWNWKASGEEIGREAAAFMRRRREEGPSGAY